MSLELYYTNEESERITQLKIDEIGITCFNHVGETTVSAKYSDIKDLVMSTRDATLTISLPHVTIEIFLFFDGDYEENLALIENALSKYANVDKEDRFTVIYTDSAKKSALESARVIRSDDKIHIKSNSEFMKSADLDIVAEKDGYIYVEFQNKTYRLEDLSKKGN